jgi:hypothetical protein
MLTPMPADLPVPSGTQRVRPVLARAQTLLPEEVPWQPEAGGSASHVCPIGTESVTHEPFGAGGAEPTTRLGPFAGRQMT